MTEWFKVADCKSVGISIIGSNPISFNELIIRNMTQFGSVSALGAERHVFKSHYFENFVEFCVNL